MMNQERFLKALQERIAMLEQAEQQDILAEYAQHIEMQMKEGLSEEEAIRDFGSLDELAAEILEAYHIDPGYQASVQEVGEQADLAQKPQIREHFAAGWHRFTAGWHRFIQRIKGWFQREPKPKTERPSKSSRKHWNGSRMKQGFARVWMQFWKLLKRACTAVLWLCWNGALLVCAVPLVLLLFCGVICFGFLAVLLFQGYPMIGVSLGILGGLMCCAAILYFGWGLVWHRTKPMVYQGEMVQAPLQESVTEVVEQIHQTVCMEKRAEDDQKEVTEHA